MVQDLDELVAACRPDEPVSHASAIARGGEHWFIGSPVSSQPGTVALAQTPEIRLVFREDDIREVRRHGERYLVRVAADANMIVSHEQVMSAVLSHCDCASDADGDKLGTIRRKGGGRIDPDIDVDWIEVMPCWWRFNCYTINLPLFGPTRVCIPTGFICS